MSLSAGSDVDSRMIIMINFSELKPTDIDPAGSRASSCVELHHHYRMHHMHSDHYMTLYRGTVSTLINRIDEGDQDHVQHVY